MSMDKPVYSESSSDTETEEEEDEEEEDDEEEDSDEHDESQSQSESQTSLSTKHKTVETKTQKIALSIPKKDEKPPATKEEKKDVVQSPVKKRAPGRSSLVTGRGVTTQMLIDEQILEAGEKCLTINYLGRRFVGDLNRDGTIKCHNVNSIFSSPSAWAMNCKKQVNPDKKSGCGWASVKYKGRKLDEFKSTWFRKQKLAQAVAASSENDSMISNDFSKERRPIDKRLEIRSPTNLSKSEAYTPPTQNYLTFSEALRAVQSSKSVNTLAKNSYLTSTPSGGTKSKAFTEQSNILYHHPSQQRGYKKKPPKTRVSVKHSTIHPNSELTTLVECAQFQSIGKIQPFSISISTSVLMLIDFHCHLTTREVSGYFAGKWDPGRQHLRATKTYPLKTLPTTTLEDGEKAENQIRDDMERHGLVLLGWYHSHPDSQPDPCVRDIKSQMQYQEALRDGHYEPCVGLIISPYDAYKKESLINAFWVRQPTESSASQVGLPLSVRFTTHQDQVLTQDIVNEMVSLVNLYRCTSDVIKFAEMWSPDSTYLDKLKHSIIRKFPQDQTDGRFLDFIHKMLMAACN